MGGIAGYFSVPTNGFEATFPSNSPPNWLLQLTALSRVHALFSYLEPFVRNGSLLPGPYQHAMWALQPAYEFTSRTNNGGLGSNDRVLVRQFNKPNLINSNLFLACAWAADGIDTNVTITIPALGAVTLLARDCGSVYELTSSNSTVISTLLDTNGLFPDQIASIPLWPPPKMQVVVTNQ